ncbi:MAG: epoxide hydrolase [Chloroflexi bacterium]|nr:epoxide hydrolase [Chloroflexota bacterium]
MNPAQMRMLPFRIAFSTRAVADLHRRIDATRWPAMPFGTGWSAGTDDAVLRSLVRYWRTGFDWFEVQERLNRHAQLRGPLGDPEGELHCFLFAPGPDAGDVAPFPLLLLHGWPGSFIELLPAAELLSRGAGGGPAFEVVVPSLPGYGFSDAPPEPGMHPGRIAERMHALMRALGYERYGVQGGDWGAVIGSRLTAAHPEAVAGLHLNFPVLPRPPADAVLTPEESEWWATQEEWRAREGAYGAVQGTKPQTLAYGLNDSPVGLLAWILEKFRGWSDHDEDLWDLFDRDAVLANVTLYWLTGKVLSAARTYYEARHEEPPYRPPDRIETPTAYAHYPAEPWAAPRAALDRSYHLVRWSEMERGGHFAAMEQPEPFAEDVASFFATLA